MSRWCVRGSTIFVEYKRVLPEGEQLDYVDVIDVAGGYIKSLRAAPDSFGRIRSGCLLAGSESASEEGVRTAGARRVIRRRGELASSL